MATALKMWEVQGVGWVREKKEMYLQGNRCVLGLTFFLTCTLFSELDLI